MSSGRVDKVILEARRNADRRAAGYHWEPLCTYCHEHEHSKIKDMAGRSDTAKELPAATHNPFAGLKAKLEEKKRK